MTPEAPDLETALQGQSPLSEFEVTVGHLRQARDRLNKATPGSAVNPALSAVSVGTPHYSLDQISSLVQLLSGRSVHEGIRFYMSTGRDTLSAAERAGWIAQLESAGVQVVVDTCTYITPIIDGADGIVLTDSAKWAYYAPGNLGLEVAFGSVEDCVESAVTGSLVFDEGVWHE